MVRLQLWPVLYWRNWEQPRSRPCQSECGHTRVRLILPANLPLLHLTDFHPKLIGLTGSREKILEITKAYRVYFSAGPADEDNDYIVSFLILFTTHLVPSSKLKYAFPNVSWENVYLGVRCWAWKDITRTGDCDCGEWYPENRVGKKLAWSRNVGNISTESRRLFFFLVWFRKARIFKPGSQRLGESR